jgi:hypothetical protein
VFQRQDVIETMGRADSTEIPVDSTLVMADGLMGIVMWGRKLLHIVFGDDLDVYYFPAFNQRTA